MPPRRVTASPEFDRVFELPRREWTDDLDFAKAVTRGLARPGRTPNDLWCNQAQALFEIARCRGALLPMQVGSGKTLTSALAPRVLGSKRPMVLVPATLQDKTRVEFNALSRDWQIPDFIRVESYEMISRSPDILNVYGPDLIFADEAHKLKEPRSGVTKRVRWYLEAHPECVFVGASGSFSRTSITEFAHLLLWALGAARMPVPSRYTELQDWASYLDARDTKTEPGALWALVDPSKDYDDEDNDERSIVRRAFQRRLTETWGVVATHNDPNAIGASLTIRHLTKELPATVQKHIRFLRDNYETPDGWKLFDGKDVARHERELAMGFFNVWDPRPPKAWLEARKEWSIACRYVLRTNRRNLATQQHLIQHLKHYPEEAKIYQAWKAIEPTFQINTRPVWVSDFTVKLAAEWIRHNAGIVWTEHRPFAHELERVTGASYYGSHGRNSLGQRIESHPTDSACIASIKANSTGRNLQHWNRSLVVSPYMNALQWEQNLGRQHRPHQKADNVSYDLFMLCDAHRNAWDEALAMSRYEQQISGQRQKLLFADVIS
jgi:hypothetical protein